MASVKWWQALCGAIAFLLIGALMWWGMSRTISIVEVRPAMGWKPVAVTALLTAALIIPIRGSVTVSTMNPSRAYFSQRRGMNHAATNPAFSLLYSATHTNDYATRYRFMEPDRARDLFLSFNADPSAPETEHFQLTTTDRPDIVLVILESFSSHLMPRSEGLTLPPASTPSPAPDSFSPTSTPLHSAPTARSRRYSAPSRDNPRRACSNISTKSSVCRRSRQHSPPKAIPSPTSTAATPTSPTCRPTSPPWDSATS